MSGATWVRWRIVTMLIVASSISYILRYNVSTAGPAMIEDLGISEIQFGWVLAAFTAGYTIFQFPGGVLGIAMGLRRALALIMVLWGVLTLLTAAVPGTAFAGAGVTLLAVIAVRFLVGAVNAPFYPLTNAFVERWFPPGHWGMPNGLLSTGLTLGVAGSTPILAWMIVEFGWRQSFFVMAPLGFVAAWVCWWYLRDDPSEHKSVNAAELQLITADRPAAPRAETGEPGWLRVLKDRNIQLLTLSYFCANYVFYQMFNWVYYYFVSVRGFDEQQAGFVTSIQWIAAAVGATLGGFVCDYITRKLGLRRGCRWTIMFGIGVAGVFMLIASMPVSETVLVVCLAMAFLFSQLIEAPFWAAAIGIGGRYTAAAGGIMNTGGNAVGFVNALLVPVTAKYLGWPAAMATAAMFAFVSAALFMFIRADERIAD